MAECGFDSLTDYNRASENLPPDETAALRARGVWEIDYRASFPAVRRRWREMSAGPLSVPAQQGGERRSVSGEE